MSQAARISALSIPTSEKFLLSRHEAAQLLGISSRMLDEIVRRGEISIRRIGSPIRGRVLFCRSELLRFAEGKISNR